ncbi:MAG: ATP-binding cassette domain-containing protein, partial [Alphaproteobacteria bacterium]|nr:ATP-binding cassette domain-containing protein [Alphaproteobacteria bacterium]
MLSVAGLSKRFGGFLAVNQVSFEVRQGEILGLIGPNGSGKSTTFNLISGALPPSAGTIRFDGAEIGGLPAYKICRLGIGRTFQIPRPFRKLPLVENVALGAYYSQHGSGVRGGITQSEARKRAVDALTLVGLPADDDATTHGLGAAALKKLELARALATGPKLLLADIRTRLGITIIWVEHIMGALMPVVDR